MILEVFSDRLRSSSRVSAAVLAYKELLRVEDFFRTVKLLLRTQPDCDLCDENVWSHIFYSFLVLLFGGELWRTVWQPVAGAGSNGPW